MIITKYDLDQLKSQCSKMVDLIKYVEKSKEYESLFLSRNDYEQSLKDRNLVPEDFYSFRLFDIFTTIIYNSKIEKYMIKIKGFYSNVLDKFESFQRSNESFIISSNFDETLHVWNDVIIDILSIKIKSNELF